MLGTDQPLTATQAATDLLNRLRAERAERGDTGAPQETVLMEGQLLATLAVVEAITGLQQSMAALRPALMRIADSLNATREG